MKATVGYYYTSATTRSELLESDAMGKWTHCLVQSVHKEMDGTTVAGIVPVVLQAMTDDDEQLVASGDCVVSRSSLSVQCQTTRHRHDNLECATTINIIEC